MATCKYCGEKVGWFGSAHDGCCAQYESARAAVSKGVSEAIKQHTDAVLADFKNLL